MKSLFDEEITVVTSEPPRLAAMHTLFGVQVGRHCGECCYLRRQSRWCKCGLQRNTGGQATDWHVRWQACGRFQEREEGKR
jgi:hypothetical protein